MLCLYLLSFAFILYTEAVQGDTLTRDTMPERTFEDSNRIARENDVLKATIENLKNRLESHQVECEQDLLKMRSLLNKTKHALPEYNKPIYSNCADALIKKKQSGIYTLEGGMYYRPFQVYCDANTFGGNWTVIQRRQDGSVDFYRNWSEYREGFGDLNGEFFIGLDKLHALTEESAQELLIELESFENEIRYAKYDAFAIGNEDEEYALNVLGSYSGSAGDALYYHKNMKFSTKNRDNDDNQFGNCAHHSEGAWWFGGCQRCHLNGVYSKESKVRYEQGINWSTWKDDNYSLKSARMLIRPKNI